MTTSAARVVPFLLLSACLDFGGSSGGGGGGQPGDGLWMGDTGLGSLDGGAADGGGGGGGDGGGGGGDGGGGDGGGGGGGSGDGGGGDGGGGSGGIDLSEACHPDIADWPAAWASYEDQVVELTNQARAEGQDCGETGVYPPADPVDMDPAIRCAARYHSMWMAENDVFDHYSTGGDLGDDPWTRMANAGFTGSPTGENIAAGYRTPAEVVQGWIDSDGHCSNLMNPDATLIGVGYSEGGSYGTYWTQDYGR